MSIEELVKKHAASLWLHEWTIRAALTEQAKTHAIELRAYEATVENLEQRISELTGVCLTVGDGLLVYGTCEAIRRAQAYILRDSSHPVEAKDTARHFANALQVAEQRIRELEAQRVPDVRCKCCGYLVTESEHKGCLRAADATAPKKEGE